MGIWHRYAHGRRWRGRQQHAEPFTADGRQRQFRTELERVAALDASGSFVGSFLLPSFSIHSFVLFTPVVIPIRLSPQRATGRQRRAQRLFPSNASRTRHITLLWAGRMVFGGRKRRLVKKGQAAARHGDMPGTLVCDDNHKMAYAEALRGYWNGLSRFKLSLVTFFLRTAFARLAFACLIGKKG